MIAAHIVPALLLVVLLAGHLWLLRGRLPRHRLVEAWLGAEPRRRGYRRWLLKSWTAFGLMPLVALALIGRLDALRTVPPEFAALRRQAGGWLAGPPSLLAATAAGGLVLGTLIRIALLRWRRREWTLGDVRRLRPRGPGERWHALWLSLTAGVTEELFFRLAVPLFAALLLGVAWPGFLFSTLLFAHAHRYQGWVGVVATGLLGAVAALAYLASGNLLMVMAVHALVDVNGLLIGPALARRFARGE